jgi:hypothetical protein
MVWEKVIVINRKKTSSVLLTTPPYVLRCQIARKLKAFTIFLDPTYSMATRTPPIKHNHILARVKY